MNHPEGRVLAIQQQMFFAQLLSEQMDIDTTTILRKLGMAGLMLVVDPNEVSIDAGAVYPSLMDTKSKLSLVKEES